MTSPVTTETAERQQCSSCDDASARCWCVDCSEALCDTCVSAHRRVTVTRSHRILNQPPAENISTPPTKFCRLHPSEPLQLFCYSCDQLTCRDCQLMGHMNHRYEFVGEALDGLKKQLEVLVQPIGAQRALACQSLRDMEIRLQDIDMSECNLRKGLMQSYSFICQQMRKRILDLIEGAKMVCRMERDKIQTRIGAVRLLQQKQQSVTETAEKAQNSRDVTALLGLRAEVESQLQSLAGHSCSPPRTMSDIQVVTDRMALETILNFGQLHISWVPFSASQASEQNTLAVTATCPPLPIRPKLSCSPIPPVVTVSHVPPVLSPSTSGSAQTGSVNVPSAQTSLNASHRGDQPLSTSIAVRFSLPAVAGPSKSYTLLNPPQPSLVQTQSASPHQNCPPGLLLTNTLTVHKVFPTMLSHSASCTVTQQRTRPILAAPAASSFGPPTSTYKLLPLTRTTNDTNLAVTSKCPVVSLKSLSTDLCPPPSSSTSNGHPFPTKPLPQSRITNGNDTSHCTSHNLSSQPWPPLPPPNITESSSTAPPNSSCKPRPQTGTISDTKSHVPEHNMTSWWTMCTNAEASPAPGHLATSQETTDQDNPPSSPECLPSDITSSCQQQIEVVRAVADSACDRSERQAMATQEPTENEPSSTVSEESEPAQTPTEEPSSVIGHTRCSLSQWQPRVTLFRLPEVYLKGIRPDSESSADDLTPSSPESPATLQLVNCSACGSANGSIICSACGRGYHRDCHVPPIGPDIWSEWTCSLCQDLSDPSDPYSCDRPPGPQPDSRAGVRLLDQRMCERLLLQVKVDGGAQLSQLSPVWSRLTAMSERLTVHRSYQTVAQFVSDVWSLLRDASQSFPDDNIWHKVQESFRSGLTETLASGHRRPVMMPASSAREATAGHAGRDVTVQGQEVTWSKVAKLEKRLRDFVVNTSRAKMMKTARVEDETPPPRVTLNKHK